MTDLKKDNGTLLYEMVHDFIKQNDMTMAELLSALEMVKMEFVVNSILEARGLDYLDEDDDEEIN